MNAIQTARAEVTDNDFQSLTTSYRRPVSERFSERIACALALVSLLAGCAEKQSSTPKEEGGISQAVVDQAMQSVVVIRTPNGGGSGFFVTDQNSGAVRVMTAKHVYTEHEPSFYEMQVNGELIKAGKPVPQFQDVADVSCYVPGGGETPAFKAMAQKIPKPDALLTSVVPEWGYAFSGLYDVALLAPLDGTTPGGRPASLVFRDCAKEPLTAGEPVFTIGHPDGHPHFTCTRGKIVAPAVEDFSIFPGEPVIDLQLDVHGGNSGGPLLDAKGRVVGIVIRESTQTKGRGFAIAVPSFEHLSGEWGFALLHP